MLKRKYRLLSGSRLNNPASYQSKTFRLMITKNNLSFSRFGFVISKKIDKRAVVRNKTKRLLRRCIEEMRQKIIHKYDMLFILQRKALNKDKEFFCREIESLFTKNKLLK